MTDATLQSWEYLETLPGTQFYRLYRSPASALAIFRKRLTSLAKTFVMMLLYMPAPLPVKQLELFVKDASRGEREYAIDLLHRYHICKDVTYNGAKAFALTPDFAKSLRRALTGAGDSRSFGQVATHVPDDKRVTVAQLDEYARQRWEGILGYMVGSSAVPLESAGTPTERQAAIQPSPGVIELLKAGHLIELAGTYSRGQTAKITKEGFAFVLQDINTQIWALLFLYVDNAEVFEMDKVEVLSFLFFVSSLELGLAYSTTPLDETQQRCLSDLVSFGIVYQPLRDDGTAVDYFYPTRLATTLTSDSSTTLSATNTTIGSSLSSTSSEQPASSSGTSKGFIIVETNYRLYAYTSSPLQIALLSLFVNLRSRHPNLVTGKMSKASVQRAIRAGITADQIISYLTSHAHPQMRRHAQAEQARSANQGRVVPILPATILDQIHLWQLERDRMTTTPGFLLKDFANHADYDAPCRYADEIGVLVWKNDKKRMFFVNRIEGVRTFMAERRANAQG